MRPSSAWPGNSASPAPPPAPSSSNFQQLVPPPVGRNRESNSCRSNVFKLLALRELSPRTKRSHKRFWGKVSSYCVGSLRMKSEILKDARQEIQSWAEAESLLHLSPKYCPLLPPPRSTIAVAFSPDGKTLASTHGDHTVKIIDCQNGRCLKVLSGHRRTPWVVRFHPMYPEIVASGSLDHEVHLWDAKTAECIGSRDFYRPIASIAFHAQGEILAVASGHKLYIWHYNKKGEASSPTIILKTRRSLRAVHFHPYAAPFILTAEVNDLDSSDPTMTLATSPGYLNYPPPTIYFADANSTHRSNSGNGFPHSIPFLIRPSIGRSDASLPSQQTHVDMSSSLSQRNRGSSASVGLFSDSTPSGYELVSYPVPSPVREETQSNSLTRGMGSDISQRPVDVMETGILDEDRSNQFFPFGDPAYWELPFVQGWLIGQSQAGQHAMHSQNGGPAEGLSTHSAIGNLPSVVPPAIATVGSSQHFMSQLQSEVATASFAAAAAAELPCTVKLRIWYHDMKNPCVPLDTGRCRLTIPHAVLCSEMGAHFSPCGRFLAVCVACILPNIDAELGLQSQVPHDVTGSSTSPTRHPISAHQVMYELRVYSLEEATFGSVLASRAIRAAHCLTSIQFSPTSEHLLLAYGRRHSSLLKSVVIDGDITIPIYTILEIYKVSNMELVRVLPSAEDEVNVACFHPSVGGGFVYGTKEGKLRILQGNIPHGFHNDGPWASDDNAFEDRV